MTPDETKKMTPDESKRLIAAAGGPKAFALQLGIELKGYNARVGQWRRRGIPTAILLEKQKIIASIKANATRRGML